MSAPESVRDSYFECDFVHARNEIAAKVVERQFAAFPGLNIRFGEAGRGKCEADACYHILYLAEAVAARSPTLFQNYTLWLKGLLFGLGIATEDLVRQLEFLAQTLEELEGSQDAQLGADYLRQVLDGVAALPNMPDSYLRDQNSWSELTAQLLDLLLSCQRAQAIELIERAMKNGTDLVDLYLEVFQPLLREVGRLWQMNRLTVAQEHYCTAVVQLLMGRFSADIFGAERVGYTVVAACVGDELHEIGLRMVADCFEMSGWDSHFLGANVPTNDLLDILDSSNADVLCLSVTLATHLPIARHIIHQVRSAPTLGQIKIVVGGYPFNAQKELWRRVNADGSAPDARAAIELCNRLVEG